MVSALHKNVSELHSMFAILWNSYFSSNRYKIMQIYRVAFSQNVISSFRLFDVNYVYLIPTFSLENCNK